MLTIFWTYDHFISVDIIYPVSIMQTHSIAILIFLFGLLYVLISERNFLSIDWTYFFDSSSIGMTSYSCWLMSYFFSFISTVFYSIESLSFLAVIFYYSDSWFFSLIDCHFWSAFSLLSFNYLSYISKSFYNFLTLSLVSSNFFKPIFRCLC